MTTMRQSDRESARQWARSLLSRSDWAILDTETTGLDDTAVVVEVGVLDPNGNTLLDTLVRPKGPIPRSATSIHGITDKMVAVAPTMLQVYPILANIFRDRFVVCYNAAYDRRVSRRSLQEHGLPDLPVTWECAMEQYARFYGAYSEYHGSYTYQKLPASSRHGADHRALPDCWATLELIHYMAERPCYCGSCGVKTFIGSNFCLECGAGVES